MSIAHSIRQSLSIPIEHYCYKDHFPDYPIVPGALLLHWIMEHITICLKHNMETHIVINKVPKVKFLAPVDPGSKCMVMGEASQDRIKFRLILRNSEKLLCVGVMEYALCKE